MIHLSIRHTLGTVLLLSSAASINAQEWARFHGTGGHGLAEAKGIPAEIAAANIKWEAALPGSGHSSPVLWGDTIFLTASDGGAKGARHVIAISATDGTEKWRSTHQFTPYRQHKYNDFASSTPCVDAGQVYVTWTSPDGVEVIAIDHSGKKTWGKTIGKFSAKHGSSASPVLASGVLVIGSHGEAGESFIIGLDPKSGDEKWSIARESNDKGSYSTPVLHESADGKPELVFSSTAHGLTAVDPSNGKIRWEHDAEFSQRCVGGPVISGDTIFAAAGSGGGGKESVVIKIAGDKARAAWEANRKGLPYVPTGVAFKGLMFLLNDGGVMTCMRASDGQVLWQERAVDAPYASPIVIGDKIYCCSKKGDLVVLEATDKFEPVSTYKFPDGIYATPAVAGGKLYVRTFSKLYCIGE
jgi:outer membrane protein assembly factor BamB